MHRVRQIWGEWQWGAANREDPARREVGSSWGTSNLDAGSLRLIDVYIDCYTYWHLSL